MGSSQSTPVIGEVIAQVESPNDSRRSKDALSVSQINLFTASALQVLLKVDQDGDGDAIVWAETGGPIDSGYIVDATRSRLSPGDTKISITATTPPIVDVGSWNGDLTTASGIIVDGLSTTALSASIALETSLSEGSYQASAPLGPLDWFVTRDIPMNHTKRSAIEDVFEAALQPTELSRATDPFPEVVDANPLAMLEDLRRNPATASMVKWCDGPLQALRALQPGEQYCFARLSSNIIHFATRKDIHDANILLEGLDVVSPSCFRPPGPDRIVAWGEIHLNEHGEIYHLDCRDEGISVPLELYVDEIRQAPVAINLASHTLTYLISMVLMPSARILPDATKILIYSTKLVMFVSKTDPSWASTPNVRYLVAMREEGSVYVVGVATLVSACEVYEAFPHQFAKVLLDRFDAEIITSAGSDVDVQSCKEEVLQFKSFILFRGRDLTVPLLDAPFVVAFQLDKLIKMLGCPDEDSGWKLYSRVCQDRPRVLVDRQSSEVLASHGPTQWVTHCKDSAFQLPVFGNVLSPQVASHLVAVHVRDEVVVLGYQTVEAARDVYDIISTSQPKVLRSRFPHQQVHRHGPEDCIKLCDDQANSLFAINVAIPLRFSDHIVALFHEKVIRMVGFLTEQAARTFFNAASGLARVYMDKIDNRVKMQFGNEYWVGICKRAALSQHFYCRDSPTPHIHTNYIVSFQADGDVHHFSFETEESARLVYQSVSVTFSKILVNANTDEVLMNHGDEADVQSCKIRAVQDLNALRQTRSLRSSPYIVAFRRSKHIKMVGFTSLSIAQCMYDALMDDQPRVLMLRRSLKPLAAIGTWDDTICCAEEVHRLGPLDDGYPLHLASHRVAFSHKENVSAIGFSSADAAHLFYLAVSKSWPKVCMEDYETTNKNGRNSAIKKCMNALQSGEEVDAVAPLEVATHIVAFNVNGTIGLIGFSDVTYATTSYTVISNKWAKTLFDMQTSELSMFYGDPVDVEECRLILVNLLETPPVLL